MNRDELTYLWNSDLTRVLQEADGEKEDLKAGPEDGGKTGLIIPELDLPFRRAEEDRQWEGQGTMILTRVKKEALIRLQCNLDASAKSNLEEIEAQEARAPSKKHTTKAGAEVGIQIFSLHSQIKSVFSIDV